MRFPPRQWPAMQFPTATRVVDWVLKITGTILFVLIWDDVSAIINALISNAISNFAQSTAKGGEIYYYVVLLFISVLWLVFKWMMKDHQMTNPAPPSDATIQSVADYVRLEEGRLSKIGDQIVDKLDKWIADKTTDADRPQLVSPTVIETDTQAAVIRETILTIHGEKDITGLEQELQPVTKVHGSKIFHKTFDGKSGQFQDVIVQIIHLFKQARNLDPDCILQLGSFAVFKYTDGGLQTWILPKHFRPAISDIVMGSGRGKEWIIRGDNLDKATLKAATGKRSETLTVLQHKTENGTDVVICEEPSLVRRVLKETVHIYASKAMEVEDQVTLNVQSGPKNVEKPYLISVVDGFVPNPVVVILLYLLLFWCGLSPNSHGTYNGVYNGLFPKPKSFYFDLQLGGESFFSIIWSSFELGKLFQVYLMALVLPGLFQHCACFNKVLGFCCIHLVPPFIGTSQKILLKAWSCFFLQKVD